jgi:hypothetical protein
MGSRFDDWVYWHFFTITVNYDSSDIELLNDVYFANFYDESVTNLGLISTTQIHEYTAFYNFHTPPMVSPPYRGGGV